MLDASTTCWFSWFHLLTTLLAKAVFTRAYTLNTCCNNVYKCVPVLRKSMLSLTLSYSNTRVGKRSNDSWPTGNVTTNKHTQLYHWHIVIINRRLRMSGEDKIWENKLKMRRCIFGSHIRTLWCDLFVVVLTIVVPAVMYLGLLKNCHVIVAKVLPSERCASVRGTW